MRGRGTAERPSPRRRPDRRRVLLLRRGFVCEGRQVRAGSLLPLTIGSPVLDVGQRWKRQLFGRTIAAACCVCHPIAVYRHRMLARLSCESGVCMIASLCSGRYVDGVDRPDRLSIMRKVVRDGRDKAAAGTDTKKVVSAKQS